MADELRVQRSTEWDAREYHRLSNPHVSWGQRVLDELQLTGDETVIDAGCGSGRLTAELLERLPAGRVYAIDISANMLEVARNHLMPRYRGRITFVEADLQQFELNISADAIFSTAAFHWVLDHQRLFDNLHRALRPGGVLVAQCGGGPNIATLLDRASVLMTSHAYASCFDGWTHPWEFADDTVTAQRLTDAGFEDVSTWLEESPVCLPNRKEYADYLRNVVFGDHLERIPDAEHRAAFIESLAEQAAGDDPPYVLDYWRLNLRGRRPE